MKFFRTAKIVISPFLEAIARIFYLAGSIEKPQIFTFRLNLRLFYLCGEIGIRTPEGLASLTVFKTAAFNHSAISPFVFPVYCKTNVFGLFLRYKYKNCSLTRKR